MQTIKVHLTRRNIGGPKSCNNWENVIKAGRKQIASIFEPSPFNGHKWHINVRIAPGFALNAYADSLPDAVLKFDELTDGKYSFV